MDHQYIQLSALPTQEQGDRAPLAEADEVDAAAFGMPTRTRSASLADHPTVQFVTPRKPVQSSASELSSEPIRARKAHILKNWWIEIGACFFFVTALLAIVATLYPHQDKPLPQWPYQISVNSLLSVYVVVLKGTILLVTAEGLGQLKWRWFTDSRPLEDLVKYDQASRGPLGALTLLWRLRFQHPLSSYGALITIFTLAIDPFTQQLIHYYDCSVPINGLQATVPRTNFYLSHGIHTGAGEESITPALQAAINAGILSPGGLVSPDCLTGNCTFHQEYSTVGYCSNCTDVSEQLIFNTTTRNGTANSFLYGSDGGVNITTSLPSGLSITYISSEQQNNLTTMGLSYAPLRVEFIVGKQDAVVDIVTGQPPTGCETKTTNNTWRCQGYGAASCSLVPCVRTYTSVMTAGEFQENSLPENNGFSWGFGSGGGVEGVPPLLGMVDTTCLSAQEYQSLSEAGYQVNSSTRWLPYNITFNPQLSTTSSALFPESMLAHECVYAIDEVITDSLWSDYLGTYFQGTVIGDGVDEMYLSLAGPQNLQTIYNYGNVSFAQVNSTFGNISDSMSNYLRQNGNANHSAPARGLVMHDETCLHVRWSWLAFPAAFVLLTVIFLVVTIIDTRPTGSRAQIWKSSPLALIFHGLELSNTYLKDQKDVSEIGNMEELATDIVVRLDPTDNGVKLVEVEREHL